MLDRLSSILAPMRPILAPEHRPAGPLLFRLPEGTVMAWPGVLSSVACTRIAQELPEQFHGGPHFAPELAQRLAALIEPRLYALPLRWRWRDEVTFTTGPLGWHRDVPGAQWKVAVYLDELDAGGTLFSREMRVAPPTPRGTVVAFTPSIEHCSASDAPKRVLGLRADSPRC